MNEDIIYNFDNDLSDLYRSDFGMEACIVAENTELLADCEEEAYKTFVTDITALVAERAGEDYLVTSNRVTKNNSVILDSISILKRGRNIAPNIFLNGYYPDFKNGIPLETIADGIMMLYQRCMYGMEEDFVIDFSFAKMKSKIIYKLINYEMNSDILETMPYIKYKDLAVTFCCLMKLDGHGIGTVRITNEQCEKWGVGIAELKECAAANSEFLMPHSFRNILNVLADLMLRDIEENGSNSACNNELRDIIECMEKDAAGKLSNSMYVLTTESGVNGASCLLYDNLLEDIYNSFECGFYILPSSVNEIIIIPDIASDGREYFEGMVPAVNREHVSLQEILSDSVYHYPEDDFKI